jgi:hypothetical protein
MRSDAERVYALQRAGKAERCLEIAQSLMRRRSLERYAWIHTYVLLEIATCRVNKGDVDAATLKLQQALSVAQSADLRLQALRAKVFLVETYDALGQTRATWALSQEGLEAVSEAAEHGRQPISFCMPSTTLRRREDFHGRLWVDGRGFRPRASSVRALHDVCFLCCRPDSGRWR